MLPQVLRRNADARVGDRHAHVGAGFDRQRVLAALRGLDDVLGA